MTITIYKHPLRCQFENVIIRNSIQMQGGRKMNEGRVGEMKEGRREYRKKDEGQRGSIK